MKRESGRQWDNARGRFWCWCWYFGFIFYCDKTICLCLCSWKADEQVDGAGREVRPLAGSLKGPLVVGTQPLIYEAHQQL